MKRSILSLLLIMLSAFMAVAQKHEASPVSLHVARVFDGRYRNNPNAVETLIQGDALQKYKLSVYRGITFTDCADVADEIEPLLAKDGTEALEREVSYKGGRLYYAFYRMPHAADNVYLFYLNKHLDGGNKITLIYMRGKANRADLQRML